MGNSPSAASEWQQQALPSNTRGDAAAVLTNGRERDTSAASAERHKATAARHLAPHSTPQSRIVVDIRSANLDRDYNVFIKQEPQRDVDIVSLWSGLQALGGLFITVLTIQKLWEDIRFIRLLRRELSTLVGSLTDAGTGGPDAASGGDGGIGISRPPRSRGASGTISTAPSAPSAAAAARQLDLHLNELSELLAGGAGRASGRGSASAAAGTAGQGTAATAAVPAGQLGATTSGSAASSAADKQQQQQRESSAVAGAAAARKETTWSSISGLTEVKILLQEATVLPTLRPDLFQGIRQPPKALLLFGPPGTGKTLLARTVATESRATFLPVTGSSVLSMWYGQSEQNVKALFEKARKRQPAIIFIDEVDSLLGKRSSGGRHDSTPDKRVTNEFLAFIDGIQTQQPAAAAAAGSGSGGGCGEGSGGDTRIVVIAATNTPWDLDEAALSRFGRRIYVPLPDKATREALMRQALEGVPCVLGDSEWQRLAERCDKYSGRDLVQVCREAAMRPLRELWGRRLLEGSAATAAGGAAGLGGGEVGALGHAHLRIAVAHQRLVELLTNSLAGPAGAGPGPAGAGASNGGGGECRGDGRERAGIAAAEGAAAAAASGSGRRIGAWAWLRRPWRGSGGDRYAQSGKQARRELERWKRRHSASWCDVDAVMRQVEARLAELRRQQQQQGTPAEASAPSPSAEAAATAPAADSPDASKSSGRAGADAGMSQAAPGQRSGEAEGGPGAAAPVVRLRLKVRNEDDLGDGGNGGGGEGEGEGAPERKVEWRAAALEVKLEVEAAPRRGQQPQPAAAPQRGVTRVTASAGGSCSSSSAAGLGASAAERAAATEAAAPAQAAPAAVPAGAGGSGGGGGPALSLQDLLDLPVARVRPVNAGDLEAALQVITCTEMDQSAKYTEWDEQYGSGATEARRAGSGFRGRVWMSMYA